MDKYANEIEKYIREQLVPSMAGQLVRKSAIIVHYPVPQNLRAIVWSILESRGISNDGQYVQVPDKPKVEVKTDVDSN